MMVAGRAAGRYIAASFPKTSAPQSEAEPARPMSRQFIYHMRGLSKTYPGGKQVLKDIHLSFYPDAKIGVLGVNGAASRPC